MQSNSNNIVFLTSNNKEPRCKKRIDAFMAEGVEATACYFERDYFQADCFECASVCLGKLSHGNYFRRMFILLKSVAVLKQQTVEASVLYCFGMDMLFLACLARVRVKKIVYEIADIRGAMIAPDMLGKLTRFLEKRLLKRVDLLVITAPGFIDGYYHGMLGAYGVNTFLLENKLNSDHVPPALPAKKPIRYSIRIGYFGLLRCGRSWEVLQDLVLRNPDRYIVEVYGKPMVPLDLVEQAMEIEGINYHGEFMWPRDLSKMYNSVDVVWACYPYGETTPGNWQWAMTNRFYESGCYEKPMICLKDSADGERVVELGLGFEVDLGCVDSAVEQLVDNVTPEHLELWRNGYGNVSKSVFVYTDEHRRLAEALF